MSTHLDLDALADLLVGEGETEQVAHLETCAACSGRLAELDDAQVDVTGALAALPPVPEPSNFAPRLDAALRAAGPPLTDRPRRFPVAGLAAVPEQAFDTADPVADTGRDPVTDTGRDPAADIGRDPATTEPDRSAGSPTGPTPRGLMQAKRSPWLLRSAAGLVAVLLVAAGGFLVATKGGGGSSSTASSSRGESDPAAGASTPSTPTSATGRDYLAYTTDRGALQQALPALLRGQPASSGTTGSADLAAGGALARLRDPAELAGCLAALTRPGLSGVPLGLDFARYDGAPALVVVLPAASPDRLDVFVVGADCAAGKDATLFSVELVRSS